MEEDILVIKSGDMDKLPEILESFVEQNTQEYTFPILNKYTYRKDVWTALSKFINTPSYAKIHAKCLGAIRIISRDKTDLHDMINKELVDSINYHAGFINNKVIDSEDNFAIAIEALKCLNNLIFNCPFATSVCCKNGTIEGILKRLIVHRKTDLPNEIKLFDAKLLFLITALRSDIRVKLRVEFDGLNEMIKYLEVPFVDLNDRKENITLSNIDVQISCEIFKVLFNVTISSKVEEFSEKDEDYYEKLVTILRDYLLANVATSEEKFELHNHIINLLTNMPKSCLSKLYVDLPESNEIISSEFQYEDYDLSAVYEILDYLKYKVNLGPTVSTQHEILSPVLTTLLKCAYSDRILRKYLRVKILPPLKDCRKRPEEGDTLRSALCRLLTSPITQVKHLTAELLFVICKENVNRMIKYTGYGNAAGLLATRGLLGGDGNIDVSGYSSESDTSDTEEYKELKHGINPVMGCYETDRPNPTANMSEEQKEYEAMQLVRLMDSLTRKGVVQPCKIGKDGRPTPLEHVLQLQDNSYLCDKVYTGEDSD